MSDQRLRELERRWRETGAVEDEAAYLLERVRVGDLMRERLELAAYCGHEGARRACQPSTPAEGRQLTRESLRAAMATLEREFGPAWLVRACVVALQQAEIEDFPVEALVTAAHAWTAEQTLDHAARVQILAASPASDASVGSAIAEFANVVSDSDQRPTSAYRVLRFLSRTGRLDLDAFPRVLADRLRELALAPSREG